MSYTFRLALPPAIDHQMLAIIGPSGAGKTSLLNCLSMRNKSYRQVALGPYLGIKTKAIYFPLGRELLQHTHVSILTSRPWWKFWYIAVIMGRHLFHDSACVKPLLDNAPYTIR